MGNYSIIMVVALTLSITIISAKTNETRVDTADRQALRQETVLATQIRNSGSNLARHEVHHNFDGPHINVDQSFTEGPNAGGRLEITYHQPHPDTLTYTVVGTFRRGTERLTQTYARTQSGGKLPESAIHFASADVDFCDVGNAFDVIGTDERHAITTESARTKYKILDDLSGTTCKKGGAKNGKRLDNVRGVVDRGDVETTDYDPTEIIEWAKNNVQQTINGRQRNSVYGSFENPIVAEINGSSDLGGNFRGYGVLLINGDLTFARGNVQWNGLVIQLGSKQNTVVDINGNVRIKGGYISKSPGNVDFRFGGNSLIEYNENYLEFIRKRSSGSDGIGLVYTRHH